MEVQRPFIGERHVRGVLGMLLALEIFLVLSLRHFGWHQTWSGATWCAMGGVALCSLYGVALVGRRWAQDRFRFRTGTLLVSFVLLSAGLAVLSPYAIRPYLDQTAARRLQSLGVTLDVEPPRNTHSGDMPIDREITSVDLRNDQMITEGASSLEALVNLNNLILLAGVTNQGLRVLSRLNLPGDVSVTMIETQVTDEGIESLQECEWLSTLFLNGVPISDRVAVAISKFRQVKQLGLVKEGPGNRTNITDEAWHAIGTMAQLTKLTIVGSDMNDEGLRALSGLTNLRLLILQDTHVTQQTITDLEESLPDCRIVARE